MRLCLRIWQKGQKVSDGISNTTFFIRFNVSGPETLIAPIPELPGGVEIAAIVFSLLMTLRVYNSFVYHILLSY